MNCAKSVDEQINKKDKIRFKIYFGFKLENLKKFKFDEAFLDLHLN